jgi:hypothetical protein
MIQLQTNFTGGQLDELLDGRVDINKYNNGLKTSKNFIHFQQGGIKGRPGSRFVAEKGQSLSTGSDSSRKAVLIPFSFSVEQQYVLEVGHHYIRFYTNDGRLESGGNPVQVETTYDETELYELKFVQSADVLYITHPSHPQRQLNRLSATSWTLTDFAANPPPTTEVNTDLGGNLTLAALTGNNITFTSSSTNLLEADVDRQIVGLGGIATVISVPVGPYPVNNVNVDILTAFPSSPIPAGSWEITGSPSADLTLDKKGPVNAIATMTLSRSGWRAADVGKYIRVWGGVIKITQVTSDTVALGSILIEPTETAAAIGGTWTMESSSWSAARGYPRAVGFHDQRLMFAGSDSEPDSIWASRTGTFTKFARGTRDADPFTYILSANQVNMIEWISPQKDLIIGTSGSEFKMTGGLNDPLTPSNVLAKPETAWGSESVNPIRADRSTVFVMTGGKILRAIRYDFDVDGYVADDLMLLAANIGYPGIIQLSFEKFPVPLIWAVRSDGVLLSMTFDPSQEVMAWSQQDTQGEFESVCSILSPDGKNSRTWIMVKRSINGVTKRYIEYFDQAERIVDRHPLLVDSGLSYDGTMSTGTLTPGAVSGAGVTFTASAASFAVGDVGKQLYQIDGGDGRATITGFTSNVQVTATITNAFPSTSAIASGSWGLAVKTVTGLDHLEGEEVEIVGDGAVYPTDVVTSGEVTLAGSFALKIDVGLLFVPEAVTLRPGISREGVGNTVFFTKGYNKVYILFSNTLGAKVNDEQVEFRSSADPMGEAPPLQSGIFKVANLGYDSDARITIKQEQPLPITVLAIQMMLEPGVE